MLFNGFPNEAIQLKLPAAMTRESECVVVSIWANMPAPWFTICRKKKSIPQGLRSPAANAARLYLFSLGETELVSFILCYLLISYSGTQSGGLACARQQGSKAGKQFIMEIAKTNTFTPVYIWDFSVPARLARRRSSVSHPPFYASLCILSALFVALTSNE